MSQYTEFHFRMVHNNNGSPGVGRYPARFVPSIKPTGALDVMIGAGELPEERFPYSNQGSVSLITAQTAAQLAILNAVRATFGEASSQQMSLLFHLDPPVADQIAFSMFY